MAAGGINVQLVSGSTVDLISGAMAAAIAQTSASARIDIIPVGMGQRCIITAIEGA